MLFRLLNWVQNKVPLRISNFTSDWKDGRAIGALVDHIAPGLCPDWSDWNPNEGLQNASEAMSLAEDWLNVPQVRNKLNLKIKCLIPILLSISVDHTRGNCEPKHG